MHKEDVCNCHLADRLTNSASQTGHEIGTKQVSRRLQSRLPNTRGEADGDRNQVHDASPELQRKGNEEYASHGEPGGINAKGDVGEIERDSKVFVQVRPDHGADVQVYEDQ